MSWSLHKEIPAHIPREPSLKGFVENIAGIVDLVTFALQFFGGVDPLRTYDIPFVGLTEGEHSFDYTLNGEFFEIFGNEELIDSSFQVDVILHKKSSFMELSIMFKGSSTVPCDRCSNPLEIPMEGDYFAVVRYSDTPSDEEDVINILPNEDILNVSQPIFETIALTLPSKRKHKRKDCDPKVLKTLDELSRISNTESDPRWDALKELKKKDDK
jgi:uncharacterized metal-binding protein YceD (DUF177 family)